MMEKLRQLLKIRGVVLTIELLLIVAIYLAVKSYSQRELAKGSLPDISVTLLDGRHLQLNKINPEQPMLLHFWASWCKICKLEEHNIQSISKDYKVISVAMSSGSVSEVKKYMQENGLDFATINDRHGELAKSFGIKGVPVSFVISPGGAIAFTEMGYTTEFGLRTRLWVSGN